MFSQYFLVFIEFLYSGSRKQGKELLLWIPNFYMIDLSLESIIKEPKNILCFFYTSTIAIPCTLYQPSLFHSNLLTTLYTVLSVNSWTSPLRIPSVSETLADKAELRVSWMCEVRFPGRRFAIRRFIGKYSCKGAMQRREKLHYDGDDQGLRQSYQTMEVGRPFRVVWDHGERLGFCAHILGAGYPWRWGISLDGATPLWQRPFPESSWAVSLQCQ